jgi:hypothetical protein
VQGALPAVYRMRDPRKRPVLTKGCRFIIIITIITIIVIITIIILKST